MSDRGALHWFPWFPEAFDQATVGWPFMARAIYRELLDLQWKSGKNARISAKKMQIANAINVDHRTVKMHWNLIGSKFQPVEGGLQNKRLEDHRLRALELHKKKSEGGRLGGLSRQALLKGLAEHKRKESLQGVPQHLLTYKRNSSVLLTTERKRAANGGRRPAARPNATESGAIREDDPEVIRKRREAETLAAHHAKPRDDDLPF